MFEVRGGCRPIVRNKANLRTDSDGRGSPRLPGPPPGLVVQTNPICRRRAGKTIVKASGLADATHRRRRRNRVKQGQFPADGQEWVRAGGVAKAGAAGPKSRKTNPICRRRTGKTILKAASLGDPTHRRRGGECAKQSQSAALGRRDGSGICCRMPAIPFPAGEAGSQLTSIGRTDTLRVGGWTGWVPNRDVLRLGARAQTRFSAFGDPWRSLETVSVVGGQCENHA
jgi:hypothetical protein